MSKHVQVYFHDESEAERLEKMNDYDKGYLITGIEDGWIDPNMDDWHIYCKLKGIDEHPILSKYHKGLRLDEQHEFSIEEMIAYCTRLESLKLTN